MCACDVVLFAVQGSVRVYFTDWHREIVADLPAVLMVVLLHSKG